jgi:putative membrane protein
MKEENTLTTRDWLAIERTKLANERTFLAYFRTFLVILGTGIAILKLDLFSQLKTFGIALLVISPVILLIGIYRLFRVKKTIKNHYKLQ